MLKEGAGYSNSDLFLDFVVLDKKDVGNSICYLLNLWRDFSYVFETRQLKGKTKRLVASQPAHCTTSWG